MLFAWLRRLFGGNKKKEENIIVDYTINNLKKGFLLDYNFQTWQVLDEYKYRFGSLYTKEFKIRSAEETLYLNIIDDNKLVLSVSSSVNINNIDASLRTAVTKENLPTRLNYEGEDYYLTEELDGEFTEIKENEWAGFSGWEYINKAESKFISVSYWEDGSIESFVGDFVKEREITNILPYS